MEKDFEVENISRFFAELCASGLYTPGPFGIYLPTKKVLIFHNQQIIEHGKKHGQDDPFGFRDESVLDYLCYKLNNHKYKENARLDNALYVSSEILYYIACRHPFIEGNKRTAYISAIVILGLNLTMSQDQRLKANYSLRKPHDEKESQIAGKTMEIIASWGEGSDTAPLKDLLLRRGVIIKSSHEPDEGDVKKFIKLFLREYIVENV